MLHESECIFKIGTVNRHQSRADEHSKAACKRIRKVKHRLRWHITCDHALFSRRVGGGGGGGEENRLIMPLGEIRNRLLCRFRKGKLEL